jgi:hypothetical protein
MRQDDWDIGALLALTAVKLKKKVPFEAKVSWKNEGCVCHCAAIQLSSLLGVQTFGAGVWHWQCRRWRRLVCSKAGMTGFLASVGGCRLQLYTLW